VTKEMHKAMLKAEKDLSRDKRRTMSMLEKLDINKIKIPEAMILPAVHSEQSVVNPQDEQLPLVD
jgi:hypothetical protein